MTTFSPNQTSLDGTAEPCTTFTAQSQSVSAHHHLVFISTEDNVSSIIQDFKFVSCTLELIQTCPVIMFYLNWNCIRENIPKLIVLRECPEWSLDLSVIFLLDSITSGSPCLDLILLAMRFSKM